MSSSQPKTTFSICLRRSSGVKWDSSNARIGLYGTSLSLARMYGNSSGSGWSSGLANISCRKRDPFRADLVEAGEGTEEGYDSELLVNSGSLDICDCMPKEKVVPLRSVLCAGEGASKKRPFKLEVRELTESARLGTERGLAD
jgi:hypothetical protein